MTDKINNQSHSIMILLKITPEHVINLDMFESSFGCQRHYFSS